MSESEISIITVPEEDSNAKPESNPIPTLNVQLPETTEKVVTESDVAVTLQPEEIKIPENQDLNVSSEEPLISSTVSENIQESKPLDKNLAVVIPSDSDPLSSELEQFADEGLAQLVNRYLEDGEIDNEELVDLVQFTIELVEKKRTLSGTEKKNVVLLILRKFLESRVNNWSQLEKLLSSAIDFSVDVAKNGINKLKITSATVEESKTAFNLIYSSTMSQIAQKYPEADDIVNNLFDIAKYILEMIEGQTSLKESEKKVLIKKVLLRTIDSLQSKLSEQQKEDILSQVDPTVSLIMIGLRAQQGQIAVNVQEAMTLFQCLFRCFRKKK